MDLAINARGLTVRYEDRIILEGLDLKIPRGAFVSLVGGSGVGKTTLLMALAGFVPSTGQIRIPNHFGVVFQDFAVFPWMTVAGNIAFGLEHKSVPDRDAIVHKLLRLTDLEQSASLYPAQLSGGQIQRVGIARALAPAPEIVFMDEPFASLDRHTRERMQTWLLDVWSEQRTTILFVTHDIDEAIFLSETIQVLRRGRPLQSFEIPFPRPRNEELKFTAEFIGIKRQILDAIRDNTYWHDADKGIRARQ